MRVAKTIRNEKERIDRAIGMVEKLRFVPSQITLLNQELVKIKERYASINPKKG